MNDGEVRAWFLEHGWEAVTISDEEGVEGWRWSHPSVVEEFEVDGMWIEGAVVSEAMRWHAERSG